MANFYIFSADHSGLPLATHIQDEGHKVTLVLIRPEERHGKWENPKNAKDAKANKERIEYLSKNGNGLVEKIWAPEAMKRIRRGDYVIFDQIYGFQYGELLRRHGVKVLGGTKVGYALETERDKTLKMFKKLGYDLPFQKQFGPGSSKKAIEFIESVNNEMLFVLKSDNAAVVTIVAEDNNDELIHKLGSESREIDKDGLILQEKVQGVEYNLEVVFCNGKPILANIDIEEKRKYNADSLCQTGCAFDLVWTIPVDHPLVKMVLEPVFPFALKEFGDGPFMIDLSVIHDIKENKVYPLEMCGNRFGYNQIYTLLASLNIPISQYFMDLLDGKYKKDIEEDAFTLEYGASLRIFNDECTGDVPITFPKEFKEHYWLWDCYKKGGKLLTTGTPMGEATGIITASADTPEGAFSKIREYYRQFHMTTVWARNDYQDDEEISLPLARYHTLKRQNLID